MQAEIAVGRGPSPHASPEMAEAMEQAGSMTPKSPAWVNEVMTKPSVQPR